MASARNADTFAAILFTFVMGIRRLIESELASSRLWVAVVSHHFVDDGESEHQRESLRQLQAIRRTSLDAFKYVSMLSHLVYATSILDTFLTDTTQFLHMLNPASIGKEFKISITDILKNESRSDILTRAVRQKGREVSCKTFLQRLAYLRKRFGLEFKLPRSDEKEIEHFSGLRNVAVHDQGFVRLFLNDQGDVEFDRRSCPHHPTVVSTDDLSGAYRAYIQVALAVGTAVQCQVLKSPTHERISHMFEALREHQSAKDIKNAER